MRFFLAFESKSLLPGAKCPEVFRLKNILKNAPRDGQILKKQHGISECSRRFCCIFQGNMYSKSELRLSQFWERDQPWEISKWMQVIPFLYEALQPSGIAMFHRGAFSSTSILPTGLSSASMSIQHTGLPGLGSPEAVVPSLLN